MELSKCLFRDSKQIEGKNQLFVLAYAKECVN